MCCCMVETSSVLPRKSSVIFGNPQQSEIFGKCSESFVWSSEGARKSSENRPKSGYQYDYIINKISNTWIFVDMEFLFTCSTSRSLPSLVGYQVEHQKRNSISTRTHLFSIYLPLQTVFGYSSKHREARQKHFATRRFFNSLLSVWKYDQTRSFLFDILLQNLGF